MRRIEILISLLIIFKIFLFMIFTGVAHQPFLVFLFSLGISLTITGLISSLNEKRRKYYLAIFYTLISLFMFIDVIYFSYFNALPSLKMLGMAKMLGDVKNSVKSLITLKNLIFILDLPLAYFYLFKKYDKDFLTKRQKLHLSWGFLSFLSILTIILTTKNQFSSIKYQEFFSYHLNDMGNLFRNEEAAAYRAELYTEEDIAILKSRAESLNGPLTGIGKEKNLIVIQVEALQNFVINLRYNNQTITPNLNSLIQDSSTIYYDNYFQLLGRGNTSDAEFVTNNSLHPSMESPTYTQYVDNTFYGLPWLLRDKGYTAWVFHGYEKDFWNRDQAYKGQGFERFVSQDDYVIGDVIELGLTDGDFFRQSMDYLIELNEKENPFYAFMITLSSHNPFTMPEEYKYLEIMPEHEGTILGDYFQSIHYVDKAIGDFIKDLKAKGIYENSIIAIYGDHFAIPTYSSTDHELMNNFLGKIYDFEDIMNVPLMIHIPNSDVGYTNSKVGSQLDFFPTILNIMGYENTKGIIFGVDLENFKGYHNVKPQTMLRKGSFIDEDFVFQIATTEKFDDSFLKDRKTGKELNKGPYRAIYEDVIWELNLGDYVLKNDIVGKVLNSNLASGKSIEKINIDDLFIQKSKDNTIDELNIYYNSGRKMIALGIGYDIYEQIVLLDQSGTLLEKLKNWGEENPDACLVLRPKDKSSEFLNQLRYELPKSKSDYIIEINSFDEYYFVKSYGFQNIMLNVRNPDYKIEELRDFLRAHSPFGIIMEPQDITDELIKEISNSKTFLYVEFGNSIQIFN